MNIFEQYGIKEVADVTLYAIELDKYDNEVYIPIMYLDTLKVSTIEQTAEQTSARGGLGNSELIIWDYGKEITVTLEDALFTPASQSLMWGGKFGTKNAKIYGVWNPFVYKKDSNGKVKWINTLVATAAEYKEVDEHGIYYPTDIAKFNVQLDNGRYVLYDPGTENIRSYTTKEPDAAYALSNQFVTEGNGWRSFICPCDNHIKYMKIIESLSGQYKYTKKDIEDKKKDQMIGINLKCPKGLDIKENGEFLKGYSFDEIFSLELWDNEERPEFAELMIKNFGDFQFEQYSYAPAQEDGVEYCISKIGISDLVDRCSCTYSYLWTGSDLLMNSLEGDQDIYAINNANIRIRVPEDSTDKQIMISNRQLYKTKYSDDNSWEYDVEDDKPVLGLLNLAERYNKEKLSYSWKYENYNSKIDIYLNIPWITPALEYKKDAEYVTRILVGTFYIIDEWNSFSSTPYEMIYPIENGMENVNMLERMQSCRANRAFAINTDSNLAAFNYKQLPQYSNTELTVFIDPKTMKPFEPNSDTFQRTNGQIINGNLRVIKQNEMYYKWSRSIAPKYTSLGHSITIDAEHFPGTYRLVGETYARSRNTGKDQRYQFEIPLAKMSAENNLTLQADGEPTTFTMTLKALRRDDGIMMKLTQYNVEKEELNGVISNSTKVIPIDGENFDLFEDCRIQYQKGIKLLYPNEKTNYVDANNNIFPIETVASLDTSSRKINSSFNFNTVEYQQNATEWETKESRILNKDEYTIQIEEV